MTPTTRRTLEQMRLMALAALFIIGAHTPARAQLVAAKDGPIVYGHHHVNVTSVDAHKKFWVDAQLEAAGITLDRPYTKVPALGIAIAFLTDPWGTYIELTEGLNAVP